MKKLKTYLKFFLLSLSKNSDIKIVFKRNDGKGEFNPFKIKEKKEFTFFVRETKKGYVVNYGGSTLKRTDNGYASLSMAFVTSYFGSYNEAFQLIKKFLEDNLRENRGLFSSENPEWVSIDTLIDKKIYSFSVSKMTLKERVENKIYLD